MGSFGISNGWRRSSEDQQTEAPREIDSLGGICRETDLEKELMDEGKG